MNYYQLFKTTDNQWMWRYVSSNGRIISRSSESYWNKADALNGILLMKNSYNDPVKE